MADSCVANVTLFLLQRSVSAYVTIPALPKKDDIQRMSRLSILAIMVIFAVAGCAPQAVQPVLDASSTAAASGLIPASVPSTPTISTPRVTQSSTPQAPVLNPLTGLPLEQDWRLAQRPILIKVSNFPRNNRPQWGLSFADIVFEHYAEGGLSRFSALFYGQEAEIVGPIRSGRLIDLELIEMYSAIFAYGSADYRVREAIANSDFAARAVSEYPARCPPMCRYDPVNLNHLITNTLAVRAYLAEQGQPAVTVNLQGMHFDRTLPLTGLIGLELEVHYSRGNFHRWVFDSEAEAYLRWQEIGEDEAQAAALEDRLTDGQLGVANVILAIVPHRYVSQTPEFISIELEGEGRAVAFRDGMATEIRWRRPEAGGVLQFETADGEPYDLHPGSTWIELVNTSAEVEERQPGSWWVRNHLP